VEPVTHALTSLLLARAAQKHLPRFGAAMLIISGIAADLDYLSYFGGASVFLRFHRTVLHSLLGSAILACMVAGFFFLLGRNRLQNASVATPSPLRFLPSLAVCAVGVAAHVLFDVASGIGVRLLWPFRNGWIAWDLITNLDPWILVILVLGIFLPELFRLVSEEIGEQKKGPRGQGASVVALLFLLLYFGARVDLHSRATDMLNSREYHGTPPLAVGAFPLSVSPFRWRGVISTDNAIQEAEISLGPGSQFDPDRTITHYKPQASTALDAAQNTKTAKRFLGYARFPLATLEQSDSGYRVFMRDMRFASNDANPDNIIAIVRLDPNLKIISQALLYPSRSNR
jgi:inner membrane protein